MDYKKAFDLLPHSWTIKCMTIFDVAENVTKLLQSSMERWKTEIWTGGKVLCKVNIKRGIFQGDSLSPLLFVMSPIPVTLVLRKVRVGYDLGQGRGIVNHPL